MARAKPVDAPAAAQFSESGGTVAVNGKTYAVGLLWATTSDTSKVVAEARAVAQERGADLFCIRKPARSQYGLGSKATGHKSGMAPLAALLSEVIEGSFVGAFECDSGYYLVAVREEKVLATTDCVYATKEEADEAYHELASTLEWAQKIAPAEWSADTTAHSSLADLLTGVKAKSLMEPVSKTGSYIKIAAAVLLVLALVVGYEQYSEYQQAQQEQADAKRAADEAKRKQDAANLTKQIVLPPYQWEGEQYGLDMFERCSDAIIAAPISVAGWNAVSVTCSAPVPPVTAGQPGPAQKWTMSVAYKRDGGTINWFGPALNRPGFRPSVVPSGNGDAVVSWPLSAEPTGYFTKDSRTGTVADARRYLVSQFEEVYQPVDLKEASTQVFQLPVAGNKKQDVPLERHLAFSFKTSHDLKDYLRILAPIPAMVANSVKLDLTNWTWTIEGTTYEKLPLPAPLQGQQGRPAQPAARPAQPAVPPVHG
jgi:hypothetical protein